MIQKKKALCEITNPYRMLQVIWLSMEYPDYEWDVVVRYVDGNAETVNELVQHCIKSGCFGKVFSVYSSGIDGKILTKIKLFFKVFIYLITFRKKVFLKKTISDITGGEEYQLYCAENSLSFLGASMMNLAGENTVFVLEDGMCDYSGYEKYPFGISYIVGLLFFKLGIVNYISKSYFPLNQLCIKYAVNPELVWEKNFKEIRKLFVSNQNLIRFEATVLSIFDISSIDYDVVIFTDVSKGLTLYEDTKLFLRWLKEMYSEKKILIKPHPRDAFDYKKINSDFYVGYKTVPGEVFLNLIPNASFIFMGISTLVMHLDKNIKAMVTHFSSIDMNREYENTFKNAIPFCKDKNVKIIDL